MKERLKEFAGLVRSYVFDGYYPSEGGIEGIRASAASLVGETVADGFMEDLPCIRQSLHRDVEAIRHADPAVSDVSEVILCYPGITAILYYRTAHALLLRGVKVIPRMLTEIAHSETGIDIHPAAVIGDYFAIDHGTGIVIGETAVVGNHVTLYQGVTLGAKNFSYGADGCPLNIPRHPVLEDGVTVYSNSSLLGRITVGHDSVIGGNVWLTTDVPPRSRILQSKAVYLNDYTDGAGI